MSKEKKIETIKNIIEFTEDICLYETENKAMKEVLNYIDELQKENEELKRVKEQSQEILRSLKIIYKVHTKDCELTLKDIEKWEKILYK